MSESTVGYTTQGDKENNSSNFNISFRKNDQYSTSKNFDSNFERRLDSFRNNDLGAQLEYKDIKNYDVNEYSYKNSSYISKVDNSTYLDSSDSRNINRTNLKNEKINTSLGFNTTVSSERYKILRQTNNTDKTHITHNTFSYNNSKKS